MNAERRAEAKAKRRRARTQKWRKTPARVRVLENGHVVVVAAKLRGPKRSRDDRAGGRAAGVRAGGDRLFWLSGRLLHRPGDAGYKTAARVRAARERRREARKAAFRGGAS